MNTLIKPICTLKDVSSLIRALKFFPKIKKVNIEIHENRNFVLKIRLPWYYIFPYSYFIRRILEKKLSEHIEPGAKIKIKYLRYI